MDFRVTTYIIATGTISSQASIDAQTVITSFPLQTDQGQGIPPWTAPVFPGSTLPEPAAIRRALDGSATGTGLYAWVWKFNYWTFDMMDYFLDTFLTTSGSRVWSKACSVRAYDDTDAAIYLNANVNRPRGKAVPGGWSEVEVAFDFGTLVTS